MTNMDRREFVKLVTAGTTGLLGGFTACGANFGPEESGKQHRSFPLLMPDDFEELNLVSWRLEQGEPDDRNPLVEPEMPWDLGGVMGHGTIIQDPLDGKVKIYNECRPAEEAGGVKYRHELETRLTYFESEDGVNFRRPKLPYVSWGEHDRTNILKDHPSGGASTYPNVFVDPENEEYPYELFVKRRPDYKCPSKTVEGFPPPIGKSGNRAFYRYRSKDGTDWEPIQGPIYATHSDITFMYKRSDGSYIAYFKSGVQPNENLRIIPYDNNGSNTLRCIFTKTSQDGVTWGDKTLVMFPDWRDPNHMQFMEVNPIPVPGGYLGFVSVYDAITQQTYLQLAASRDGLNWWTVDRRPALANEPLGDYGGGMMWQLANAIVQDNRLYVYYGGTEGIHGEIFDTRYRPRKQARYEDTIGIDTPTLPFASGICRASWRYDRMYALVSSAGGPVEGRVVTTSQDCSGKELRVNVLTKSPGELNAELVGPDGSAISGFTRQDCIEVSGDHNDTKVTWSGGSKAPPQAEKVRFYLHRAFLYGFKWA